MSEESTVMNTATDNTETPALATETTSSTASSGNPPSQAPALATATADNAEASSLMGDGEKAKPKETTQEGAEVVEIDYKSVIKAPEGYELNAELSEKAFAIFNEEKLPTETAQKIIDTYFAIENERQTTAAADKTAMVDGWKSTIETNPKYQEELPKVRLAIADAVEANPDLKQLFNDPVFGNMPEIWQIMAHFGNKLHSEGQMISGGKANGGTKKSAADAIFG